MFQAAVSENEVCFAEIPIKAANTDAAASIQYGELRVDIHAEADAGTTQELIQALRTC